MIDHGTVAERLALVQSRITDAGGQDVTVLAVTKGFGSDAVSAARAAGLEDLGENYAQELLAKAEVANPTPRWHAIGRLQRNKVRLLSPHVWCWQSVDRPELAAEIARRAPGARVLVQVAAWDEQQKGGAPLTGVPALVESCRTGGLDVAGLMAVAPFGGGAVAARGFAAVRALADRLELRECSMGMSDDIAEAVAEGSTMVRVGRGLFGPRSSTHAVRN